MDVQINDSKWRSLVITHLIGDTFNAKPAYNSGQLGAALKNLAANAIGADKHFYDFGFCLPFVIVLRYEWCIKCWQCF
jgi:hypothetical protein